MCPGIRVCARACGCVRARWCVSRESVCGHACAHFSSFWLNPRRQSSAPWKGRACFAMWWFPVRCPPEWRRLLVSRGTAVFWLIASACCIILAVVRLVQDGMSLGVIFLLCAAFFSGFGAFLTLFCRLHFQHIEFITWCLVGVSWAASSLDSLAGHVGCQVVLIAGPLYFGMPFRTYLPYLLWVAVVFGLALNSFSWLHEVVIPLRRYIGLALFSLGFPTS